MSKSDAWPAYAAGASGYSHGVLRSHHASCLTGVNVLFIGDSTMRYEYLALVNRLHKARQHGSHNLSTAGASPPLTAPHLPATSAHSTDGCQPSRQYWLNFYEQTTEAFGDRMLCDCFRLEPDNNKADCCDQTVENRVYYGGSYRLAYLQWFGQYHMPRGNVPLKHALHAFHRAALPTRCPPGYGSRFGWSWNYSVVDLLRHELSGTKPTHIIMNAGHWGTSDLSASFWRDLAAAGARLRRVHSARVIWRTTVRQTKQLESAQLAAKSKNRMPWGSKVDAPLEPFVTAGWEVYDADTLVRRTAERLGHADSMVFADGIHLRPDYDELLVTHVLSTYLGCCDGTLNRTL